MGISIIYLTRHGETAWNQDLKIQGQTDIPLNENGRRQAEALAERLKDVPLEAIYTSDLQRAYETARIVAARQQEGIPVVASPGLRECNYGLWEGLTREEIFATFRKEWEEWLSGGQMGSPPQGEDFLTLEERAVAVFEEARQSGRTALLCAHRGPLRAILCRVLGIERARRGIFSLGNCSLSALECRAGSAPVLLFLNDTCHLDGR